MLFDVKEWQQVDVKHYNSKHFQKLIQQKYEKEFKLIEEIEIK